MLDREGRPMIVIKPKLEWDKHEASKIMLEPCTPSSMPLVWMNSVGLLFILQPRKLGTFSK